MWTWINRLLALAALAIFLIWPMHQTNGDILINWLPASFYYWFLPILGVALVWLGEWLDRFILPELPEVPDPIVSRAHHGLLTSRLLGWLAIGFYGFLWAITHLMSIQAPIR